MCVRTCRGSHYLVSDVQNEVWKVSPLLNNRIQRTKKLYFFLTGKDVQLVGTEQEESISELIAE